MNRLCRLLKCAFSDVGTRSGYEIAPWSIAFVYRATDVSFVLFYFKKQVLSGSIADKKLTVLSKEQALVNKVLNDFSLILPEYKVNSLKEVSL